MEHACGFWRWVRGLCLWACPLALVLTGCASIEFRAVDGHPFQFEARHHVPPASRQALELVPDCCQSLRDLPYQVIDQGGKIVVDIGLGSPAHRFVTGKSFFAAYRLSGLPRPALVEVTSFRAAEPGAMLQVVMPDARQAIFQPTLLFLNSGFEVVRRVEADSLGTECGHNWAAPVFKASAWLTEPPADVAYLVITTSDKSMARAEHTVCGLIRDGMSPVGELHVQTRTLPLDDPPLGTVMPVFWHPDVRREGDVGFWRFLVAQERLLVLGQRALHIFEPKGSAYRLLHTIAYDRVVRVSVAKRSTPTVRALSITAIEPAEGREHVLRDHTFELPARTDTARVEQVQAFLTERITATGATQTIGWEVLPEAPVLVVRSGTSSRVAASAVAAGVVTAFPCGLCQTGACPPEMLGPCAALFSVGALLGGAAEMVKGLLSTPDETDVAANEVAAVADGRAVFGANQLADCLGRVIEGQGGLRWQDGGLTALSVLARSEPAAVQAYGAEVLLKEVALVQMTDPGVPASSLWRLHLEAQLTLLERRTGQRVSRRVVWESDARPSSDWLNGEPDKWVAVAEQGCVRLADSLLDVAEKMWRDE